MRVRSILVGAMAIAATGSPLPVSAQDACKSALELTARASDLYAQVGRASLPNECVGLRDRIAKFDAAADALKDP